MSSEALISGADKTSPDEVSSCFHDCFFAKESSSIYQITGIYSNAKQNRCDKGIGKKMVV
jgi:hypothetical protein